jgi:hypothetical protein
VKAGKVILSNRKAATDFSDFHEAPDPVDDNAFLLLKTPRQQAAFLHVSGMEWKNMFSFEIYGRQAKLHIRSAFPSFANGASLSFSSLVGCSRARTIDAGVLMQKKVDQPKTNNPGIS